MCRMLMPGSATAERGTELPPSTSTSRFFVQLQKKLEIARALRLPFSLVPSLERGVS